MICLYIIGKINILDLNKLDHLIPICYAHKFFSFLLNIFNWYFLQLQTHIKQLSVTVRNVLVAFKYKNNTMYYVSMWFEVSDAQEQITRIYRKSTSRKPHVAKDSLLNA